MMNSSLWIGLTICRSMRNPNNNLMMRQTGLSNMWPVSTFLRLFFPYETFKLPNSIWFRGGCHPLHWVGGRRNIWRVCFQFFVICYYSHQVSLQLSVMEFGRYFSLLVKFEFKTDCQRYLKLRSHVVFNWASSMTPDLSFWGILSIFETSHTCGLECW